MTQPARDRLRGLDQPLDDDLVNWLTAYDERLRCGNVGSVPDPGAALGDAATPANLRTTLHKLEQFWPRREREGASVGEPSRIGRFVVERTLGQGGFGIVYLAFDPALGRRVALKVPRLHALADAGLVERFRREARAAAALDHPNIVPVHETGQVGSLCYIASAYCPGPTLAQWLKQRSGPVEPRLAARLIRQVAEAVHYSHTRGVLHRDIKPGNILLAPPTGQQHSQDLSFTPRLTDFGLAKLAEQSLADATLHTHTETASRQLLGTPAYIAPEQAGGQSIAIGPACDVYSLGAVLYELLAGRPPFAGSHIADLLNQVLREEPVPLSRLRRDVPPDLETICLKCLEKDPQQRYFSARQLADDLQNYLSHRPIMARRPSVPQRVVKWSRRHPAAVWSGLAILLMSTVALSLLNYVVSRARTEVAESSRKLGSALAETQSALTQRQVALDSEAQTARRFYPLNIASAQKLVADGQLDLARDHLKAYAPGAAAADRQSFEWRHLWSLANNSHARVLQGHTDLVFSLSFSPDARRLASASGDGTVRIWDVETGNLVLDMPAHPYHVNCVAYSPDGRTLATASDDFTIALWNSTTGERLATLLGHAYCVQCVAFSRDGRLLASATAHGEIRTWDRETGETLASVRGRAQRIRSLAISPDGQTLATVDDGPGLVRAWSLPGLQPIFQQDIEPSGTVQVVAFDPRSERLVTAFRYGGGVLSLNSRSGEPIALQPRNGSCLDLEFSLSGDVMAIAGSGPAIDMLRGPDCLSTVYSANNGKNSWCVACSPDGRHLAAGSDADVLLWDLERPPSYQTLALDPNGALSIACSPGNSRFVVGTDGSVRLFDLAEMRELRSVSTGRSVRSCRFSSDGRLLATGGDGGVSIRDPDTLQVLRTLAGLDGPILDIEFTPHGQLLTACNGSVAKSWDTATWEPTGTWGTKGVRHVATSFDNRVIIGENPVERGVVYMTQADPAGISPTDPPGESAGARNVHALAASSDGILLAVGFEEGRVGLWNLEQYQASGRRELTTLGAPGMTQTIAAVAFSSDRTAIAAVDLSGALVVWDIASGTVMLNSRLPDVATLPRFRDEFDSLGLAFTSDDSALIVVGDYRLKGADGGNGFVFVLHAPHVGKPVP